MAPSVNAECKNGCSTSLHPFDPITGEEIEAGVAALRARFPGKTLRIKALDKKEPPKTAMIKYLTSGGPAPRRVAYAHFYTSRNCAPPMQYALIDLAAGQLIECRELAPELHGRMDGETLVEMAPKILQDERVQQEIARLRLSDEYYVQCEPWPYGTDGTNWDRMCLQGFFYLARSHHPEHNYYAHPLDFTCVYDLVDERVISVSRVPIHEGETEEERMGPADQPYDDRAPDSEYAADLQEGPPRTDYLPIRVLQPEGPSFTVKGNKVNWQKWSFVLGFNHREGPVLHDLCFDGRPTWYRLSMSEMFVPYGDPTSPFHRKSAFDLGEAGAGVTANSLRLGCDCLGVIKYFDAYACSPEGKAVKMQNVVCMHEVDTGIGWKHTQYRSGKASVVRNRELIIQTIITVSNYEYIFQWVLGQAGEVHFETIATGIMSTQPKDLEFKSNEYGIAVAPGCFAPAHQHLFSLRFDPAIDGYGAHRFCYEESKPIEADATGNKYGVAYRMEQTQLEGAGHWELDPKANRVFKVYNPDKKSSVNGKPRAYKLVAPQTQMLLADPSSYHYKRAAFARHPVWVTKYHDDQLFSAGEFTNQSRGDGTDGLDAWIAAQPDVDDDGVLWYSYGFQHQPRLEDWPVMPTESLRISLKPVNFFDKNPTLDVPQSTQQRSQSKLYEECCK